MSLLGRKGTRKRSASTGHRLRASLQGILGSEVLRMWSRREVTGSRGTCPLGPKDSSSCREGHGKSRAGVGPSKLGPSCLGLRTALTPWQGAGSDNGEVLSSPLPHQGKRLGVKEEFAQ